MRVAVITVLLIGILLRWKSRWSSWALVILGVFSMITSGGFRRVGSTVVQIGFACVVVVGVLHVMALGVTAREGSSC